MLSVAHPQAVPQRRPGALESPVAAVLPAVPHQRRPLPAGGLQWGEGGRGEAQGHGCGLHMGRPWAGQGPVRHAGTPTKHSAPQRAGWGAVAPAAGCRRASGRCAARGPAAAWHSRLAGARRRPGAAGQGRARRCRLAAIAAAAAVVVVAAAAVLAATGAAAGWAAAAAGPAAGAVEPGARQALPPARRWGRRPLPRRAAARAPPAG